MRSLDSWTFGWLNGSMCSSRLTTAVACSHTQKSPPSGPSVQASAPEPAPAPIATRITSTAGDRHSGACVEDTTTGSRPTPSLPVDSATSCSAQSPNPGCVAGSAHTTSLSRPSATAAVRTAPSAAPADSPASSAACARAAEASSAAGSTPASAVGVRPKAVSAL